MSQPALGPSLQESCAEEGNGPETFNGDTGGSLHTSYLPRNQRLLFPRALGDWHTWQVGQATRKAKRKSWCLWRSGAQEVKLVPAGCCLPPNPPFTASLYFSTLHLHPSCELHLRVYLHGP